MLDFFGFLYLLALGGGGGVWGSCAVLEECRQDLLYHGVSGCGSCGCSGCGIAACVAADCSHLFFLEDVVDVHGVWRDCVETCQVDVDVALESVEIEVVAFDLVQVEDSCCCL